MPELWLRGFKGTAIVLCLFVLLPVVQMLFRTQPLNELAPIVQALAATSARPPKAQKETKNGPLPPTIEKRSSKLQQSGILGRTPKPPPMALIGIAEPFAFLQTPDGQTGKVKEGETLRGVKVLKVGSNRVLVEHDGQTSELSIFSGIGSESLMPTNPR